MRIQTSVSGFGGRPVTLLSIYDEGAGTLTIAKAVDYREAKIAPDMAVVSNVDLPERDAHFTDDQLRDSIRAYFAMSATDYLILDDSLARFRPDNRIEQDKVDESGRKYRVAPEIDNGQIAVLATVWFAESQKGISSMLESFDFDSGSFSVETI